MLEVLLPLDRERHGLEDVKVHQRLDVLLLGIAVGDTFSMLPNTANKVVGDANIDFAAWVVCKDVGVARHRRMVGRKSPRVKREGDERVGTTGGGRQCEGNEWA